MQLVFYSNYAGRLVLGAGQSNYWNTEVYPLESIKEFEQISSAWRLLLARLLKEGFSQTTIDFQIIEISKLQRLSTFLFRRRR
jgi:hypothetical protein